jgi:hypothetical protein
VNPFVASLIFIAGLLILWLPRHWAAVPFVLIAPVIPSGQLFEVGPLHIYATRVLLIFLLVRVIARSEYQSVKRGPFDRLILLQFVCGTAAYVILRGDVSALINRLGWMLDGLGIFFTMRWTVRDSRAWVRVVTALAFVCLVISFFMVVEQRTDRNAFYVLGGVDEFTEIREGRIRSQGPFGHPILAGVFAANLFPLFLSLKWLDQRKRTALVLGVTGAAAMVLTSSSSTPVMAFAFGLLALAAFSIRKQMRLVRWSIVGALILLQLVMHNPVWALLARANVVGGSTGYYRYWLMDNFIRRFWEWFLVGVQSTAVWGRGLWDVTIMYVRVGVDGGFLALVLFLAVIVSAYKQVGRMVIQHEGDKRTQKCIWALGAALTGHVAAFFAVNYWDQNVVSWYLLLAIIAGSAEIFVHSAPAEKESVSVETDDTEVTVSSRSSVAQNGLTEAPSTLCVAGSGSRGITR